MQYGHINIPIAEPDDGLAIRPAQGKSVQQNFVFIVSI